MLGEFARAVKDKALGLGNRKVEIPLGKIEGGGLKKAQEALNAAGKSKIDLSQFEFAIDAQDV